MHPSTIEWTEATWNPIRGCVKVSPGCKHCYAEAFAERFEASQAIPTSRALMSAWCPTGCRILSAGRGPQPSLSTR